MRIGSGLLHAVEQAKKHRVSDENIYLLIEQASEEGATRALAHLGLSDENAGADISELRALLDSWRDTKKNRTSGRGSLDHAHVFLGPASGACRQIQADTAWTNIWPIKDMGMMLQKTDNKIGHFEGYASVFNVVDRGNDLILPGAFKRSLQDRGIGGIKFLWQHDPKEPMGILDEIYEDARGLYVRGRLILDVERAREAYQLLGAGALDGLSIGFHTLKSRQRADGVRLLTQVDLWEISLVTFPMNEQARISAFKSDFKIAVDETAFVAGLRHLTALMAPSSRNDAAGFLQRKNLNDIGN